MMRQPDEAQDVIVHKDRSHSDGVSWDTWTIWLGGEIQGERQTLEAAVELARHVAAVCSRPAWLLDETGYPLKPVEGRPPLDSLTDSMARLSLTSFTKAAPDVAAAVFEQRRGTHGQRYDCASLDRQGFRLHQR